MYRIVPGLSSDPRHREYGEVGGFGDDTEIRQNEITENSLLIEVEPRNVYQSIQKHTHTQTHCSRIHNGSYLYIPEYTTYNALFLEVYISMF